MPMVNQIFYYITIDHDGDDTYLLFHIKIPVILPFPHKQENMQSSHHIIVFFFLRSKFNESCFADVSRWYLTTSP